MKKFLAIIIAGTMLFSLAACGGGSSAEKGSEGSGKAEYVIKYATADGTGGVTHQGMLEFKELIEEASDGRVAVEIYADGILGGEREILEAQLLGTVQMSPCSQGVYAVYDPKLGVTEVSFMFDDYDAFNNAMDGEAGELFASRYADAGFTLLGTFNMGFRALGNNVNPIQVPTDLNGLKIRTPEVEALMDCIKAMGASPVPISWSESYTALQQGTVDGMECSPVSLYDSKLHEVLDYITDINHVATTGAITISTEYFESLPEDIQQMIVEAAETCEAHYRENFYNAQEETLAAMEDYGCQLVRLTPEERAAFEEVCVPARDKWIDILGQEEFDLWRSYSK